MQILLAGKPFTAVRSVNLTREAETPKHTLESGADISDHVLLRPAVFELELELFNIEEEENRNEDRRSTDPRATTPHDYGTLQDLYEARTPITFVSPQGVWENMIIATLSDKFGQSTNTTRATVVLHQVLIVESQTVSLGDGEADAVKVGLDELFPGCTGYIPLTAPSRIGVVSQGDTVRIQQDVSDLAAQQIPDAPEPGTSWAQTLLLYAPEVEAVKKGLTRR